MIERKRSGLNRNSHPETGAIMVLSEIGCRRSVLVCLVVSAAMFCNLPAHPQNPVLGPQIQVSANIYEYRLDTQKQLGLFYQYNRDHGSLQTSDVFLHGTDTLAENPIPAVDLSGSFATLVYGSIDYNLKTAIEEGRATIISSPNITTRNGVHSSQHTGEKIPMTVVTVKGNQTTLAQAEIKTGINLSVTPHIYRENNVLMDLELESSETTRYDIFDRGDGQRFELPVITKRKIQVVVIVPSGKQLLVGGLFTENSSNVTRKVPIAGNLPVIGYFLRGFNKRKGRTETIFQITPTIKPPGSGLDYEAPVFRDLLTPKEDEDAIINKPRVIRRAPIQGVRGNGTEPGLLPGSVQSQIPSATGTLVIPNATKERIVPPSAEIPSATKQVEPKKKKRRRDSKGRPIK